MNLRTYGALLSAAVLAACGGGGDAARTDLEPEAGKPALKRPVIKAAARGAVGYIVMQPEGRAWPLTGRYGWMTIWKQTDAGLASCRAKAQLLNMSRAGNKCTSLRYEFASDGGTWYSYKAGSADQEPLLYSSLGACQTAAKGQTGVCVKRLLWTSKAVR